MGQSCINRWRLFRLFVRSGKQEESPRSLFQSHRTTESQVVNIWCTPVGPVNVLSVMSLLDTGRVFSSSTVLKPNSSAWSGDPYHHRVPRSFASKSVGSEQWSLLDIIRGWSTNMVIYARRKESWAVHSTYPVLERLFCRILRMRPQFGDRQLVRFVQHCPWSFVMIVKCLLVNTGMVIRWPPRSPDLAPTDFRRRRFQGFKMNVSADVNTLVSDSFDCCFANCRNM
jgi:hypothetical protein